MTRRTVVCSIAALLGIVATGAVAWSASQLASQRIGISSEPLSVAGGLAPHSAGTTAPRGAAGNPHDRRAQTSTSMPPAPPQSATTSSPALPTQPPSATSTPPAAPAAPAAGGHDDSGGGAQDSGGQRDD